MSRDYIRIDEAVTRCGLHPNTLRRLLRQGVVRGFKSVHQGKSCWLVSVHSLQRYTDPISGTLVDLRGPKTYLKKQDSNPSVV